jgi:Protein of unknown function (DUF2997)
MKSTIEIIYSEKTGEVSVETSGFTGSTCLKATESLKTSLGTTASIKMKAGKQEPRQTLKERNR